MSDDEDYDRRARTLDDGSDAGGYIVPPAMLAAHDRMLALAAGPPDTATEGRDRTETTEAALQRIAGQCVEAEAARDERITENAHLAAALGRVEALHTRGYAGHGPDTGQNTGAFCDHCSNLKHDYVPWPCPTRAAAAGTDETGADR